MRALIVQDLGFGDSSKGATVDVLTRHFPVDQIIRFNGGSQALHHVSGPFGVHGFSQFGSGSIANPNVKTHLSRFMLINPVSMKNEAEKLNKLTSNVWNRTTIDKRCVVITPMHKHLNQLREKSRENPHGSCGVGVGVARELSLKYGSDVLLAGDLDNYPRTVEKMRFIVESLQEEVRKLEDQLGEERHFYDVETIAAMYSEFPGKLVDELTPSEYMLLEGAQGVLLDEKHGFHPHTTWTNCTFENADTLLDEVGCTDRIRIGCFRSYFTRHGHGPLPTEDSSLIPLLPELHNGTGVYQGSFRVGKFDYELAKKSLKIVGGVDFLSISHLDYLPRISDTKPSQFLDDLELTLKTPIGIEAYGPSSQERIFSKDLVDTLQLSMVA